MAVGEFPLSGVAGLPHVDIAYMGEHWSDRTASGAIVPGQAVVPVSRNGKLAMRTAKAGDTALVSQLAIAVNRPTLLDTNTGPSSVGPNAMVNATIADGKYVHAFYSGVFNLTLIAPDSYAPADLIGWDADGARPAGIAGTGSWAKNSAADLDSIFEVMEFRPLGGNTGEGILTVRSLRGQF